MTVDKCLDIIQGRFQGNLNRVPKPSRLIASWFGALCRQHIRAEAKLSPNSFEEVEHFYLVSYRMIEHLCIAVITLSV
jgi:hypothetical protein